MDSIHSFLVKWNKDNDNLAKVQGVYAVLAVAMFVIAGLVSLVQPSFGQSLLFFAIVALLTFIGNGVIWALVRTFVISHIEKQKPTTTRKSK